MKSIESIRTKVDWPTTLIPFVIVLVLMVVFMLVPEQSKAFVDAVRSFLGDTCGLYYALFGVAVLVTTLYVAFSKYGKIRLGDTDKPEFSNFKWGTMIFTSTMAADILFYSLCEWALYGAEPHVTGMPGGMAMWAPTFTLFHWGPIAWCFYVILAIAFGFMMHVRKRDRQRFSEAVRPLLGDKSDGFWGKLIDVVAIFAIVCATATTFSLATPLLSKALSTVLGISDSVGLAVVLLLLICTVYTLAVWFGIKGISRLATFCSYLFFALLFYFLFLGGETRFILETGFQSIGNLVQNFVGLSTYMDPLRETSFAQNWTIYYWAYWIVWCCATPFFIALIYPPGPEPHSPQKSRGSGNGNPDFGPDPRNAFPGYRAEGAYLLEHPAHPVPDCAAVRGEFALQHPVGHHHRRFPRGHPVHPVHGFFLQGCRELSERKVISIIFA